MKEAIQTLLTSDKMAHAFEYLKQDEAHTIDQQIELVQISSFSPFEEKRAIRFKELLSCGNHPFDLYMMISETKYLLIPISYDRNIIARKRKFVNKTEKTNNSVSILYIGNIVREQKEKEGRKKVSV